MEDRYDLDSMGWVYDKNIEQDDSYSDLVFEFKDHVSVPVREQIVALLNAADKLNKE